MMPTHNINLFPTRRDENWKYSDLRSSLNQISNGIESINEPFFTLPDGLTTRRGWLRVCIIKKYLKRSR